MMNNKNNNQNIALETECDNCNSKDKWVLHNVRVRGMYKRLCTSCVLKLHPGSFCPTCFELFEVTPAQHLRVDCQKCSSFTHPHCVPNIEPSHSNYADNGSKGYVCPHCSNPNASLFELPDVTEGKAIDLSGARVLMCAARIASLSMNKAVFLARSDAEKRVKESVVSRKRAREALENLVCVAVKEKLKRYNKENGVGTGTRTGTGMLSDNKVKIERGEALGKVNDDKKEKGLGFSSKNGISGLGKNGLDVLRVDEKVKVEKNDNGDDKEIVPTVTNVGEQGKEEEKNREEELINNGLLSVPPGEDQGKKIEHNDSMKKEDAPKKGSNESLSAHPTENHEKESENNHSMKENGDP